MRQAQEDRWRAGSERCPARAWRLKCHFLAKVATSAKTWLINGRHATRERGTQVYGPSSGVEQWSVAGPPHLPVGDRKVMRLLWTLSQNPN
jgi:hypothetical protein